jgi:hypothetical protein
VNRPHPLTFNRGESTLSHSIGGRAPFLDRIAHHGRGSLWCILGRHVTEDSHVVLPTTSNEDYRNDSVWGPMKLQFWNAGTSSSGSSGAGFPSSSVGHPFLSLATLSWSLNPLI